MRTAGMILALRMLSYAYMCRWPFRILGAAVLLAFLLGMGVALWL